jgi:L-asparaginase
MRKKILLILTGGTISMDHHKDLSYDVLQFQKQHLMNLGHSILNDVDIDSHVLLMKPSPHITPLDMLEISNYISSQLQKKYYDGFVVTHGTDTLEETAFFLDLYFSDLEVPIILTGSMRNYSDIAYDGMNNIVSSILVAAHDDSKNKGVLVVLNDTIHHPHEVTKSHTVSLDTFQSLEFGPIGVVDDQEIVYYREFKKRFLLPKLEKLNMNVGIYKTYTGDDGSILKHYSSMNGLIIEGFGRGNVPENIVSSIQELIDQGVTIMITSRVPKGRPFATYPYKGGAKQLVEMGCYLSPHLNSQKARILLIFALSTHTSIKNLTV